MHSHFCDTEGHYWQCSGDCQCICGTPMEGNDHGTCPIELRPCPEHQPEAERALQEAQSGVDVEAAIHQGREYGAKLPHCDCGCADTQFGAAVGFCLHCDHVYTDWSPAAQDRHFAEHHASMASE
jgi:hypothetical protein